VDTVSQFDQDQNWLLNIQRKLYQWSGKHPGDAYGDLWNWITDPRNLRVAYARVASNKGSNSPGIDGITIARIYKEMGEERYITYLRHQLRSRQYKPSAVLRKWIPKPGKPGKVRGLGIPTIEDRVVQSAIKQIIEPIFEARFLHVSHGFRPGRAVRDAIENIRAMMRRRDRDDTKRKIKPPFTWIIEGDIQSCFDEIDHHALMELVRKGIMDSKVNQLIIAFLKSGILDKQVFNPTLAGTPQGGILSPLLANIALHLIEERYRRWVYPEKALHKSDQVTRSLAAKNRTKDSAKGHCVFYPIRYADDFVILCSENKEQAEAEKQDIAIYLKRELGLTLSPEKTKVTRVEDGFLFLGHRIRLRETQKFGWILNAYIPPQATARFRQKIKRIVCRKTIDQPLEKILDKINPIIEGWGRFYQHASWAWKPFNTLDQFIFQRIQKWLEGKHLGSNRSQIYSKYYCRAGKGNQLRWVDGESYCSRLLEIPRGPWDPRKRRLPHFMHIAGEPGT